MYPAANQLDRETALRLWTEANTWFSTETGKKGQIKEGQLADLAVLSDDYFYVPEETIQDITSVLTIVDGKPVHGDGDFKNLAPPLPAPMPDWSPVRSYGGYQPRIRKKHPVNTPLLLWPVDAAIPATFMDTPMQPHGQPIYRHLTRRLSGERSAALVGRFKPGACVGWRERKLTRLEALTLHG